MATIGMLYICTGKYLSLIHISRSTMRVPQPDIIEHFGNADAVPQPPERCLSRQAGIVRCCPTQMVTLPQTQNSAAFVETGDGFGFSCAPLREESIF